jgi:hypothetical protein
MITSERFGLLVARVALAALAGLTELAGGLVAIATWGAGELSLDARSPLARVPGHRAASARA